jgi:hypothetical protein
MKDAFCHQIIAARADSSLDLESRLARARVGLRATREASEALVIVCKHLARRRPHHLEMPLRPVRQPWRAFNFFNLAGCLRLNPRFLQ